MRLIELNENEVSLNYMYLPTFIGLNSVMLQQMEEKISPMLVGKEPTTEVLDAAHEAILDFIEEKFSAVTGLRDYLDGLKFIEPNKS